MPRLSGEDKAGLYITVIIHLTVIVVLLLSSVSAQIRRGESFVIDFSREEALEKKAAEQRLQEEKDAFDELIDKRIEDMIAGRVSPSARNMAVDRSSLKDDRGTDAQKLYEDADKLARELREGYTAEQADEDYVDISPEKKKKAEEGKAKEYSGPSVVSYDLGGRKASHLSIPAYRCYGGGIVVVLISVDNSGRVTGAKVQDSGSSDDSCLREYALIAAKQSRFSADPKAPARQNGDIVYQFIPQKR